MKKEVLKQDLALIDKLLSDVFGKSGYQKIERLGGLTNHTYHIWFEDGKEYAVRIPGVGTENLIVRSDEKKSTELACQLGIDAKCVYFGSDGSKITEYIAEAETMSADKLRNEKKIKDIATIFKKLHSCGRNTGVAFEVFDMAEGYENIIFDYKVPMFEDYNIVKQQVMDIKSEIDRTCDTTRVPCHNDSLCENWIYGNGRMYLIDWEYAGMNDKMWDLADVSIEAVYDYELDKKLLTEYFGEVPDAKTWKHFLANKIYVDFLWTLWAKTRVPFDGQSMEDWALERYVRLKENVKQFN
jgi:thiamine kinase-like enzyme